MHQKVEDNQVRVKFPVPEEESGFPPVNAEYLWCTRDGTAFIVDNIPFYVREISLGDRISAKTDEETGELLFEALLEGSSNSTIRVFVRSDSALPTTVDLLESFGCSIEGTPIRGFVAVSAPREAKLTNLFEFLDAELERGTLTFEESAVRYQ